MFTFHRDPAVAEQQMHALIFSLTAFGYIDGDFAKSEKEYIRAYISQLVQARARAALGDDLTANVDVLVRWTGHFHEVLDGIDNDIQALFAESVPQGEDTLQFVTAKLKLRAFELFTRFGEAERAELLETVDELMHADGVVEPREVKFRDELKALLQVPIDVDDVEIEPIGEGHVVIEDATAIAPRELDHPFLKRFEHNYATDRQTFERQAAADLELIAKCEDQLERQRAKGRGRLAGAKDFGAFAAGDCFLDGHVYVSVPMPSREYELLVLGDLHGCYSCLKAALLQADFFSKVQAYKSDPAHAPLMLLVLLGDYIDRGRFSYNGILRAVMQLYLAAPEHVFLLRGNHEYYIEHQGRVLAPVRPAEAMTSLEDIAPAGLFATYMRLFEALPNMLVFDRTLFVHGGIPREDTLAQKFTGIASLNDPELRFQMLWSDPSEADAIPLDLQKANARFPFGKQQFRRFMSKLGCTTMVRGHERIIPGFKRIYDEADAALLSVFSAGGASNGDLPESSNYREVTPMALTIRHKDGVNVLTPFAIEYERFNDPKYNAFFTA